MKKFFNSIQILCAGIGGRGVLLASTLLMDSAIRKDVYAIGSDEYGMSQRGGSVVSLVKVGKVKSPFIGKGNADIILGFEESEFLRNLSYLKIGGIAVVNSPKETYESKVKEALNKRKISVYTLDADGIAREGGLYQASNMAILGFFSSLNIEPFTYENLKGAILERLKGKMVEKNLLVFERGFELGREIVQCMNL
ncbi:MAG: 2-oxoacid:acceptor oxidoreductase family protein [Deltaproteobacteria bacterium]|nr:2-oxoacid:acceptor oxidoreductase family protein [Deltaproteobacteria bacterium]